MISNSGHRPIGASFPDAGNGAEYSADSLTSGAHSTACDTQSDPIGQKKVSRSQARSYPADALWAMIGGEPNHYTCGAGGQKPKSRSVV